LCTSYGVIYMSHHVTKNILFIFCCCCFLCKKINESDGFSLFLCPNTFCCQCLLNLWTWYFYLFRVIKKPTDGERPVFGAQSLQVCMSELTEEPWKREEKRSVWTWTFPLKGNSSRCRTKVAGGKQVKVSSMFRGVTSSEEPGRVCLPALWHVREYL